jgi:hypothetical protein
MGLSLLIAGSRTAMVNFGKNGSDANNSDAMTCMMRVIN